jgi:hypothetical protein
MKNFWIPWARNTLPTTTRKIVKAQDWFEALLIEISSDSVFPAGRLPDVPEIFRGRRTDPWMMNAVSYTLTVVKPAAFHPSSPPSQARTLSYPR